MVKCEHCEAEFEPQGAWETWCWVCAYKHEYNRMSHRYSTYQETDFDNYISSSENARYWGDTQFDNDDIPF